MISSQLLFLFSALGSVNGIFLAFYFFSRRPHRLTHAMLGALLLAIGFRTVKSAFYYFNPDLAVAFIQLGLSACLLIGPLTYLYVHCHLADVTDSAVSKHWRSHLLLPLCLIGIALLFPYSRNTDTWFYAICGIHAYWFSYLLLAGRQLWQARAVLGRVDGRFSRQTVLLLSVYFSSLLILVAYVSTPFTSYIIGALSFTFSIHITILTYIMKNEAVDEAGKKEKYHNKKMSGDDVRALLNSLDKVMCEQQLYLNPALNLAMLAKKVGNLQTTVSQAINENLNKSFNLYINEFRIQHAKNLLITASHLNMELVAERSGFNSNSTFFSAFKKITGQTPASYRAVFASVPLSSCGDGADRASAPSQRHRVTSDS
ncbi:AraC family transcriptional regulator [Janthinobacterium lividum]|uniref:AraC family transcriptional regulator n=1 Tax=Janthinobacterium lividum TaxID=29581 RepID=UPI00126A616A|nr:helix-turn-helix domain-containing protein [Janthinobacterium lividum]